MTKRLSSIHLLRLMVAHRLFHYVTKENRNLFMNIIGDTFVIDDLGQHLGIVFILRPENAVKLIHPLDDLDHLAQF